MKAFLLSKLKLSEDEFARTSLLALLFFLLVNGIFFGRNARDSIFLVKVGLAALPYAYMLNAVIAIGSAAVYAMFVDKLDRFKFVRAVLILFIATLATVVLGLKTEWMWFYWATYSLIQVVWLMSLMMFWTFAADFFDAVQAKRIFPLVGMGGLVGMITSGLVAKPLVKTFGTEKLFIAWAVLLGAGLLVVAALARYRPKAPPGKAARKAPKLSQWQQFLEGFRNVRRTPLLVNMVVLILALWLVFTLIDYQFSQVARANFTKEVNGVAMTDKDALTSFLGIFRSWAGACCLLFQIFLTPLAIRKLGVTGAMTLHPAFLLFSIGSMIVSFGFASACVTKFGDHVLLYTATDVAYQLLFNPIPPAQRGRARAFVEGYIKPFSMGLAGAALLLLVELKLEPAQIAACNFGLAAVWFVATILLRKNYLKAVVSNLQAAPQAGVPVLSALSIENAEATVREMEQRLKSANQEDISFAIEYFLFIKYEPAAALCVPLLEHANPEVRRMACRAIGQIGGRDMLTHLEDRLGDPHPDVVREALAGFRRLGSEEQIMALEILRMHPDIGVVAEAVETEAEIGGFDGILSTAEMLKRWAKSEDPRELELLASILGRLRIKSFLPTLLEMARHANPKISRAAVRSLTAFKDERVIPALVDALRDDILFPHVQRYFASCGEHLRTTILLAYRQEVSRRRVKLRFLAAIARNTKWDPTDLLLQEIHSDEPAIRDLCVVSLAQRIDGRLPAEEAVRILKREIEHWIRIETLREHLLGLCRTDRARDVTNYVFDQEARDACKLVFIELGFLSDRLTLQRVYRNAVHGAPAERALALEALENMGDLKPWTGILLPVLNGAMVEARREFLKHVPDAHFDVGRTLEDLVARPYEYMISAILYVWKDNPDPARRDLVASLRSHSSALVREHAAAVQITDGGLKTHADP
ncbi:MAG: hypothetical protein A3G34_02735 [Candidatus Lindowbacteria bacterium RIFCSPLOWO2_12_FULL_62_27]|nr:MAG: hypothetical protein A3G34_02735 [Candidatus Lindowbacteria bacterium RIFCSPLOWO2_12_FULL_62_27]